MAANTSNLEIEQLNKYMQYEDKDALDQEIMDIQASAFYPNVPLAMLTKHQYM